MKKNAKYIKWVWAIVLLLVPCVILAGNVISDAGSSPLWDMFKNLSFNPPPTDLSVGFLAKFFGRVPGVPQFAGVGTTILGYIFSVFNAGILALSGVFLSYTIFKVVTETTMDGSSVGKAATMWTAVRVGISTSLLIPQAGGYSMINGIIMWVVIQSIGLADLTWSEALRYLEKTGGGSYSLPKVVDYSLINYDLSDSLGDRLNLPAAIVGSADVLRSLACAKSIEKALEGSQEATKKRSDVSTSQLANANKSISGVFSVYKNVETESSFVFPFIEDSASLMNYGLNMNDSNVPTNLTGICGVINYGTNISAEKAKASEYLVAKRQGLESMITALSPVAEQLIEKSGKGSLSTSDYELYKEGSKSVGFFKNPDNHTILTSSESIFEDKNTIPNIKWPDSTEEMLMAATQYQLGLESARMISARSLEGVEGADIAQSKRDGWITAGGYYYLLKNFQAQVERENEYYRSVASDVNFNVLTNENAKSGRELPTMSNTYSGAFYSLQNVLDVIKVIDTGKPTRDASLHTENERQLANVFEWIYLSAPYSKFFAKKFAPAETILALPSSGHDLSDRELAIETDYNEPMLDRKLGFGAAMIALAYIPFAAIGSASAIPLLIDVPKGYLIVDVNNVVAMWQNLMGRSTVSDSVRIADPILKLHLLGNTMMEQSIKYFYQMRNFFMITMAAFVAPAMIWQTFMWGAAPYSFFGASSGFVQASTAMLSTGGQLQSAIQGIIYMNIGLGLAIVGPMFITGMTLSIYVPLIPYMLFLFGIISWFISVLVLMAAAPIICFLMLWGSASQENPLLSREAEQFVMQVIGVFFRPILMVIGLIAGMGLSTIGVDILNLGFINIYEKVVLSEVTGNEIVEMIKNLGFMIVYTFTMVSIVNMSFSTIHLLYSEAMRIAQIQAPAVGMEEKHAEAVKAGAMEFGQAGSAGMKESATSLKGVSATGKGGVDAPKKENKPPSAKSK